MFLDLSMNQQVLKTALAKANSHNKTFSHAHQIFLSVAQRKLHNPSQQVSISCLRLNESNKLLVSSCQDLGKGIGIYYSSWVLWQLANKMFYYFA